MAFEGFGVRVYASGVKVFTVRYRLLKKQCRKDIGVYRNRRGVVGEEITFTATRVEAERILSQVWPSRQPACVSLTKAAAEA